VTYKEERLGLGVYSDPLQKGRIAGYGKRKTDVLKLS
jgi:hypothetical protein